MAKPAEALGGIRKLLQDVIAPEVQGIKASLAALHEGQQLIRDELKAQGSQFRDEMKAQEGRFREEMRAQEARLTRAIETSAKETILTIQLAESERRTAEAERRSSELARRLEESSSASAPSKH